MDISTLAIGTSYEVFNPKYGTFQGELVELDVTHQEAVVRHNVAGVSHDTVCNFAYSTLSIV